MKTIRLLVLAVLLIGCAHLKKVNGIDQPVKIDPVRMCTAKTWGLSHDVSERTLRASIRATDYWNNALGCRVFSYQKERATIQFREVDEIPGRNDILEPFYKKIIRRSVAIIRKVYTKSSKCMKRATIFMTIDNLKKYSKWTLESVYRHELGHALGLIDIPYQAWPSLMSPITPNETYHPLDAKKEDIKALRKIHCGE